MDTRSPSHTFLAAVLRLDAAASGAMGLGLALGADALAAPLGLPAGLLREAGLSLLPFAAIVAYVAAAAARGRVMRGAVTGVIAANALWVLGSLATLATPAARPATALGLAFVLAQAAAVVAFAALEWAGLRRAAASVATA